MVLIRAVSQGDKEMVEILINNGTDLNQTDHMGVSALGYAKSCGDIPMADFLRGRGGVMFVDRNADNPSL
jgi:ankyrin repeat protein